MIRDPRRTKPPLPFASGGDVAGEVPAVGPDVTTSAPGDRILGLPAFGGYATHIRLDQNAVIWIPDAIPFDAATRFALTNGTSCHALKDRARPARRETVPVPGAADGVGAAAPKLAKTMGAWIIAAVPSGEKARFRERIGTDASVIHIRDDQRDFTAPIEAVVEPAGGDVVHDAIGCGYAEPAFRPISRAGVTWSLRFSNGSPKCPSICR